MYNQIESIHRILGENLNQRFYFQSLMEAGLLYGLLADCDMARIKSELSVLLAEQSYKLNGGRSSSVRAEDAEELIKSIFFVLGIRLKAYSSPCKAAEALKTESVKQLFEKGLANIQRRLIYSKRLQKRILENLFCTPNVYYRSTVEDGINGFFKLYRPQFYAHETIITADYPVLTGRPQLDGIEFIERYLQCIEAENAFLVLFDSEDIHRLLCGVSKDYHCCPINIFEPVLMSALALVILRRTPLRLELCPEDISCLYEVMYGKSDAQIKSILESALCDLTGKLEIPKRLEDYAAGCITTLVPSIRHSVEEGRFDKVFIVPDFSEDNESISFSCGERMEDDEYRRVVEKIQLSDSSREKVEIIFREVLSMADLLDVLTSAQLSFADFELFVNMLPQEVFLFLLSRYPDDSFLEYESEQLLYKALLKRKSYSV